MVTRSSYTVVDIITFLILGSALAFWHLSFRLGGADFGPSAVTQLDVFRQPAVAATARFPETGTAGWLAGCWAGACVYGYGVLDTGRCNFQVAQRAGGSEGRKARRLFSLELVLSIVLLLPAFVS